MARVRVVTRTIEDVVAECKVLKTVDNEDYILTEELHLGGQIDPKNALKVAQKMYNTEDYNVVKVISTHKETQIYGMLETDFIKLAKKMDDERKFISDDGTEVSLDEEDEIVSEEPEEKPKKK